MHSAQDSAETPMENNEKETFVKKIGDSENMFACDICNSYTDSSSFNVKLHKRVHLYKVHLYHCTNCTYSTSKRGMLYEHKKTHVKYSCEKCDFAHNRRERFRLHMVRHEEEKNFICKICKKTYKHASSLTKHTNSHGVNYPCNKCNKKYTYQDQLKRHKALKHEEGHIKMHHCKYCAYKSFRADVLRNHMSAKHTHA